MLKRILVCFAVLFCVPALGQKPNRDSGPQQPPPSPEVKRTAHKGHWKDDKTIEFEPLQAGMMGQLITEIIRWYFPDANTIAKTSMVTMPDGNSMSFEFNG